MSPLVYFRYGFSKHDEVVILCQGGVGSGVCAKGRLPRVFRELPVMTQEVALMRSEGASEDDLRGHVLKRLGTSGWSVEVFDE